MELLINSTNINSFLNHYQEKDFYFEVGNQKYYINRILIDLLSEKIINLHKIDPTINSYKINTKDENDLFIYVMKLIYGESIEINENFLFIICNFLYEIGLNTFIIQLLSPIKLNNNNIITLINQKKKFNININNEIEFIIKEISLISKKDIIKLTPETFYLILSNKSINEKNINDFFEIFYDILLPYNKDFLNCIELFSFEVLKKKNLYKLLQLIDT